MAYMRQPSSDPTGETYLRVLVDGMGTNQIAELVIHCSNGRSYNASVEGGTTGNYRSTTQTFTGLTPNTSYTFWATGRTSGGTAIDVPSSSFKTLEAPASNEPSITALSVTATGTIAATWNVANSNYMRTFNSMQVFLSGPNNAMRHNQGFLQASERSFTKGTDGLGAELVVGATYTIWVSVYDTNNFVNTAERSVVFTRVRPSNFAWTNSKVRGLPHNLTTSEWRSLLDTINLFRAYKKLAQRDFNHTVTGVGSTGYIVPSASSFNAARNAINDMSPPTSVPSIVGSGGRIYASDLNRLRDSLNSIV